MPFDIRHAPSYLFLDHGDATPDASCYDPISTAAVRFQLHDKCCSREGITFLPFLYSLCIGSPEVGRTAPDLRMEFTAHYQETFVKDYTREGKH